MVVSGLFVFKSTVRQSDKENLHSGLIPFGHATLLCPAVLGNWPVETLWSPLRSGSPWVCPMGSTSRKLEGWLQLATPPHTTLRLQACGGWPYPPPEGHSPPHIALSVARFWDMHLRLTLSGLGVPLTFHYNLPLLRSYPRVSSLRPDLVWVKSPFIKISLNYPVWVFLQVLANVRWEMRMRIMMTVYKTPSLPSGSL